MCVKILRQTNEFVFVWFRSKGNKNIVSLLLANMLSLPVGLLINILCTKYLGVIGFGNYAFVYSIYGLAVVIFNFGLFQAGNRAFIMAVELKSRKEYYGANFILLCGIALLMAVVLALYALLDQNLTQKGMTTFFILTIPSGIFFLCAKMFETILYADGRIRELAVLQLFPKVLFLLTCVLFFMLNNQNDTRKLLLTWYANVFGLLVVQLSLYFYIKPSYQNLGKRICEIFSYNKTYGFHLYLGSVFTLGANLLSPILVGYFGQDTSGVVFFSMAVLFSAPLSFVPNTLATSYYKTFSTMKSVPRRLSLWAIGLSIFAISILWIILPWLIHFCYGSEYNSVIFLNKFVSIAMLLYGLGDIYNRFLRAHGKGVKIRNGAIITAAILLISNYLLIPRLQDLGASIALLISGSAYFISMYTYYLKGKKTISSGIF